VVKVRRLFGWWAVGQFVFELFRKRQHKARGGRTGGGPPLDL
jgi:hypothetical protein